MVFKNKKDKFAVLLGHISTNLREATNYFADYKLQNTDDLKIFTEKMKEYERNGDTYVHDMILELNDAFITPIEREDLLALTNSMDDVLDGIEECSGLFELYNITKADEFMIEFVEMIRNCAEEIEKAIDIVFTKKLDKVRPHAIKIKEYESHCDEILRKSLIHLFQNESDPIRLIKYKDLYENMEDVADYCQTVANILETIIMKNA
ncbi:hypothetical protein BpJC7_12710 [Weizmannia acidilactici]|uniref:DUF47 domain-containing protein n=1 Tax=Weizmannia acidilactici TaxID=2607726 RepID=A0A5J4JHS7_9BACI|nr:DUF47 domain-containing protein [Weizmannia acidilactici]GER65848.1 hypothetical protein BpJC4_03190 [Weizmannia acidilactici]GER69968.1 hypothetical protein BpJC7_12710 [Weizmannia acidilactici]GER73099.1 hypothetical protein BpPP18_11660 [Weizmannia acidilactici]